MLTTELQTQASETRKQMTNVKLTCTSKVTDKQIELTYKVENADTGEIFLLDIVPTLESIAIRPIHLSHSGGSRARLLQGIAPLPINRQLAVRVIPKGTQLGPDKILERKLVMELPLREQGPYDPAAGADSIRAVQIEQLELIVQYLPSAKLKMKKLLDLKDALVQIPKQELYEVSTLHTVGDAVSWIAISASSQ